MGLRPILPVPLTMPEAAGCICVILPVVFACSSTRWVPLDTLTAYLQAVDQS